MHFYRHDFRQSWPTARCLPNVREKPMSMENYTFCNWIEFVCKPMRHVETLWCKGKCQWNEPLMCQKIICGPEVPFVSLLGTCSGVQWCLFSRWTPNLSASCGTLKYRQTTSCFTKILVRFFICLAPSKIPSCMWTKKTA